VDRSVLAHKSGTIQSQLLLALKYLGLLTDAGRPTDRLHRLVGSHGVERRNILRELVHSAYAFVFGGGFKLESATTHQAEELFASTGASGETVRRCLSFFLAAARAAGIPVSPYIKPHRGKRPVARAGNGKEAAIRASSETGPGSRARATKAISLRSGGSLTLELSIDVFELDPGDRDFVFQMIDQLRRYGKETPGVKQRSERDPAPES
jgi:hypothetical protein